MGYAENSNLKEKMNVWRRQLIARLQTEVCQSVFDGLQPHDPRGEALLHRCKGSCQCLGLKSLAEILQAMEAIFLHDGNLPNTSLLWEDWINELEREQK